MRCSFALLCGLSLLALGSMTMRSATAADQPPTARTFEDLSPHMQKLVAADSPLKSGDKLVFFGDSITQAGGYHQRMAEALKKHRPELDVKIINAGISGHKVPNLQARIERDVLAKEPTVVFIYIGINDVWHSTRGQGTPIDKFEAGLHEIIAKLKEAGAIVILATPTTIGEKHDGTNPLDKMLEEYAAVSRKVAAEENIPLCDLRKAFIEKLKTINPENKDKGLLTNDGVHMLPTGNALIAEHAAESILSALSSRK